MIIKSVDTNSYQGNQMDFQYNQMDAHQDNESTMDLCDARKLIFYDARIKFAAKNVCMQRISYHSINTSF